MSSDQEAQVKPVAIQQVDGKLHILARHTCPRVFPKDKCVYRASIYTPPHDSLAHTTVLDLITI